LCRAQPSAAAGARARSGLAPSAALGARLALERGRGRTAVPVRSTMLGVTVAIAGLTLALGFGASLHHLLEKPRLYGIDWDVNVHFWDGTRTPPGRWTPALQKDPAVAEFSTGNVLIGNEPG